MRNLILLVLFFGVTLSAHADSYLYHECFDRAARHYNVDPRILRAIARVESGYNPMAIGKNTNSTEDIGMMQINSAWLPVLNKYGITRDHLFDPCINIHVGAWILSQNIAKLGPTWEAVGAYNARSTDKRKIYIHKVWQSYQKETNNTMNWISIAKR